MITFTVQAYSNRIKVVFSAYITEEQYHEIIKAISQEINYAFVQGIFNFNDNEKCYKGANIFIEPTKDNIIDLYDILMFILMF